MQLLPWLLGYITLPSLINNKKLALELISHFFVLFCFYCCEKQLSKFSSKHLPDIACCILYLPHKSLPNKKCGGY